MKTPVMVERELDPDKEQAETLRLIAQLEAVRETQSGEKRRATDQLIATMRRGLVAAQDSFAGIRHRAVQREKGRKAAKGIDGRTMRDVIEAEVQLHDGLAPQELLEHVNGTARANDLTPISIKRLKNVLAELRRK